jgi:peptidoglycan hydrolase-like protein with peptidoglycan-binding domain
MKRILCLTAILALAACASSSKEHSSGSTYGGSTTTPSTPSASAAGQAGTGTAVIQPSELAPEQVRLVQRALSDRGFAVDLSGAYDDRTQTALMDFQRARGLPATGNLNSPTVEALGLDPRDVMPVRGSQSAQPGSSSSTPSGSTSTPSGSAPSDSTPPAPPPPPAQGNMPGR